MIRTLIRLSWATFKTGWWLPLAFLYAVQHVQADTLYTGGGAGTHYQVTVGRRSASFIRTGPHQAGATLHGARLVDQKGNTSTYAAPIPKQYWSAFAGARRPVECRLVVHFADHHQVIDGIHASMPCTFFHGAELGFGLHGGDVLRLAH